MAAVLSIAMIEGGVMPKEEWGVKRVCPTTGKRFYDLGRDPIVSPYTGEVVELDTGKGGRALVSEKPTRKPAPRRRRKPKRIWCSTTTSTSMTTMMPMSISTTMMFDDDDDDTDTVALDDLADVAADDDDS
jgi:uncharacterized protein (TIGR02300 family)